MVIICFKDGTEWYRANWIFRQLSADVESVCAGDNEISLAMEKAGAIGTLFLDRIDSRMAARILDCMRQAATAVVDGKIPGWIETHPEDIEGDRMYVSSMSDLLKTIERQVE